MASAGDNRLAAARLMKVAAASRLPPATNRPHSPYTTPGDTTRQGCEDPCEALPLNRRRKRERFLTDAGFTRLG